MQSYKCPNCGRIFNYGTIDNNVLINCLNCRYPLKKVEEVRNVKHPELNQHNVIGIIEDQNKNIPKCPTCSSINLKKISTTAKAVNTVMFGLLGTKRHKTFHCNNCGYEW